MKFLCPFCSQETPQPVECADEAESASCPSCKRRFRLKSFLAEEISSTQRGDTHLYNIIFQKRGRPHIERFFSQKKLSLQKDHQLLVVRYGRDVLGIADQTRNYWFPVIPVHNSYPLWNSLLLSLVWPISALALLQIFRLLPQFQEILLSNAVGVLLALLLLIILFSAPLLLWTMRTLFPLGPGKEHIRGYDPRL